MTPSLLEEEPVESVEQKKSIGKTIVKIALQSVLIFVGVMSIGLILSLLGAPALGILSLTAAFPIGLLTDKLVDKGIDKISNVFTKKPQNISQVNQQSNNTSQVNQQPQPQNISQVNQQSNNTSQVNQQPQPQNTSQVNQQSNNISQVNQQSNNISQVNPKPPWWFRSLKVLVRTATVLLTLTLAAIVAAPFTAPILVACAIGCILGVIADFGIVKGFQKLETKIMPNDRQNTEINPKLEQGKSQSNSQNTDIKQQHHSQTVSPAHENTNDVESKADVTVEQKANSLRSNNSVDNPDQTHDNKSHKSKNSQLLPLVLTVLIVSIAAVLFAWAIPGLVILNIALGAGVGALGAKAIEKIFPDKHAEPNKTIPIKETNTKHINDLNISQIKTLNQHSANLSKAVVHPTPNQPDNLLLPSRSSVERTSSFRS
jgi:hypothetical protein